MTVHNIGRGIPRNGGKEVRMADSVIEVVCNGKKGYFDVETYRANRSTAICIECEGKLYTPSDFEKFCGKEKAKKWRNSIKYQGQPIDKYLESIGIKSRKKNTAEEKGIPRKRANPSITSDSDGAKRRRNGTADEASASGLQNGSGESSEEDSMEEMEEQVRRVVSESSPSSLGRGVQVSVSSTLSLHGGCKPRTHCFSRLIFRAIILS